PALVQRIASLGRELVDIDVVAEPPRVLVLAAGSTEIFGLRFHDAADLDAGLVDAPAYVDHARYMEYVRDAGAQDDGGGGGGRDGGGGDSGGGGGLGAIDTPRLFAVGPQSLALVTQRHVLELFHLDRSYRELSRTP